MLATLRSVETFPRLASMLATPNDDLDSDKCALDFIRSATMAADLDQFQQLLNTLLSTDNDARTQAEVCKTLACLVAVHNRYRSRRQKREYTRSVRCGTFSGEHVADVLSELACGCCNGTANVIRDPSIGSSVNRAASIRGKFIAKQLERFRLADKYNRARSAEKSKMVSCMQVARARVLSVIGPACSGKRVRRQWMSRISDGYAQRVRLRGASA